MEINWLENIAYRVERSVNRLRFEWRADFYRLLVRPCFVSFEKSTDFSAISFILFLSFFFLIATILLLSLIIRTKNDVDRERTNR